MSFFLVVSKNLCFSFDDAKLRTFSKQGKYFYVFYSKNFVLLTLINKCSRTHKKKGTKRPKIHFLGILPKIPVFELSKLCEMKNSYDIRSFSIHNLCFFTFSILQFFNFY